ncbi:hypothetical protein ACJMK2_025488 [Sinanodonta woodiana]|uniref:Uncharacterized protein n=1 Tax=Sinanodonta woodiana TaxID=1069815 RepID=A0ABD3XKD8_SINWO
MDQAPGSSLRQFLILGCFLVVFLFKFSHTQDITAANEDVSLRNNPRTSIPSANQSSSARIKLTRQIVPIQQTQELARNNFLQRWANGDFSNKSINVHQDTFQPVPIQGSINMTSAGEIRALNTSQLFRVSVPASTVDASQFSRTKRQADTRAGQVVETLRRNPLLGSSQQLGIQGMGINSQLQNSQIITAPERHIQREQQQFRINQFGSDRQWSVNQHQGNPTIIQQNQATQFSQQVIQPERSLQLQQQQALQPWNPAILQQQQALQQWSPTRFQQQHVPWNDQWAAQQGTVFHSVFPSQVTNPGLAMSLLSAPFAGEFPFITSPDMWQEMMFGDTTDPPDITPPPESNTTKAVNKKQTTGSSLPQLPSTTVAPANVAVSIEKIHTKPKLIINSNTQSAHNANSKMSTGSQQKIDDLLSSLLAELQNTRTLLEDKIKQQPTLPASTHKVQTIPSSKAIVSTVNNASGRIEHTIQETNASVPQESVERGRNASVPKHGVTQGTKDSIPKVRVLQRRKRQLVSLKAEGPAHIDKAIIVLGEATAQQPQPVITEPTIHTYSEIQAQNATTSNPSLVSVTASNPSLVRVLQELLDFFKKRNNMFTTSIPFILSPTTSASITTEEA